MSPNAKESPVDNPPQPNACEKHPLLDSWRGGILQLADVPFSLRDILEPSVFRWLSGLCMVSRKGWALMFMMDGTWKCSCLSSVFLRGLNRSHLFLFVCEKKTCMFYFERMFVRTFFMAWKFVFYFHAHESVAIQQISLLMFQTAVAMDCPRVGAPEHR